MRSLWDFAPFTFSIAVSAAFMFQVFSFLNLSITSFAPVRFIVGSDNAGCSPSASKERISCCISGSLVRSILASAQLRSKESPLPIAFDTMRFACSLSFR